MSDDLGASALEACEWTTSQRAKSLRVVFEHAVGLAHDAEAWYARKRPVKRRWGRALRVGAIVLGAAAAVLPILTQIYTGPGSQEIAPAWAAVALAGAAMLVALDHYFGFSDGWMRFMLAEQRITRLRHNFEYAWNREHAFLEEQLTAEQVAALLELARGFVLAVDDVVGEETSQWVTEFRGSLERTERSLGTTMKSPDNRVDGLDSK